MSVAVNIVNIGIESALRNQAHIINEMVIEVGTLSGIIPDALEFCYESACIGTMAEGSKLTIITIPAEAHCPACNNKFEANNLVMQCPACAELVFDVRGGRDLRVKKINID